MDIAKSDCKGMNYSKIDPSFDLVGLVGVENLFRIIGI